MQTVKLVSKPGYKDAFDAPFEARTVWPLVGRMTFYSLMLGTVGAAVFGFAAFLFLLAAWGYVAFSTPATGPQSVFHFWWGAAMVAAMLVASPLCGGLLGGATGLVTACYSPPREAVWPFASQFFRCVWRNVWGWTLGVTLLCGIAAVLGWTLIGAPAWLLLPLGATAGHIGGAWRGLALARHRFPAPAPILPEVTA